MKLSIKFNKLLLTVRSGISILLMMIISLVFAEAVNAQYFGKNKPRYQSFDFKVHKSKHFDLYNYLNNVSYRNDFLSWSEEWHTIHQAVLGDTLPKNNPILLYNNHPEFQQTNAVQGEIGVSTGGVTEAFKNRVVMPLALSRQQTHHVLGHELVHAFQYAMIINNDSMSLRNLSNLPLWMVEGMAEYLSVGRHDPHTAMWMRDAVANDDIPTLKDLSSGDYFPYRYGQAFWAFVSGYYGDSYIKPLFEATARKGLDHALDSLLSLNQSEFSDLWAQSLKAHYEPLIKNKNKNLTGKELIGSETGGESNVAPEISPNGEYVAFWSEKNVISFDLYVADAQTGEIVNTVTQSLSRDHFDYLNFMESGGTWSPDSKKLAYVVVEKGRHIIVVKNALTGKTIEKYKPKRTTSIHSPTWSPDGNFIAYVGMVDGKTNLYRLSVKTGNAIRLTDDEYAQIQPSWSEDSENIVFTTDYLARTKYDPHYGKLKFNLAVLNTETEEVQQLDILPHDNSFDPVYTRGDEIWFISDHKGYKNLFSYDTETGTLHQRTDAAVGVSGITQYSPALSYSSETDRIVYNTYFNKKYSIHSGRREDFKKFPVNPEEGTRTAGILPPTSTKAENVVNKNLDLLHKYRTGDDHNYSRGKFKPRFKLDYLTGSAGAGVGMGTYGVGSGLAGGIQGIFSDITGDHQIYATAGLNGEIYDIGLAAQYINRKHRIQWGASVSHVPSRIGGSVYINNTELPFENNNGQPVIGDILRTDIVRIYQDQIGVFAQYPLSRNYRFEIGTGATYQYFRADRYDQYYGPNGVNYFGSDRNKIDVNNSLYGNYRFDNGIIYNVNGGFVGDNSYMGPTGPIAGWRFRVSGEKMFGLYDYHAVNADFRRYIFWKPVTLGMRLFHYGRLGQDANTFYPYYIGQLGLVRGLNFSDREFNEEFDIGVNQLLGSKILMSSVEVRLPFTGIERLALIPLDWFYSDLIFFGDVGTAFNSYENLTYKQIPDDPTQPVPVTTAGIGIRVNLFGLVVEPYYSWFIRDEIKGSFGISLLLPGW